MRRNSSARSARFRHSLTKERPAIVSQRVVERAFGAARYSIRARSLLTAIAIFLLFASVVVVLWVGAQDVLAGRITPGVLGQFVLYAVLAASGLGQLSEVWGELSQASGAAERLFEILAVKPDIKPPGQSGAAAGAGTR